MTEEHKTEPKNKKTSKERLFYMILSARHPVQTNIYYPAGKTNSPQE
jgi:hypothetical protein